MDYRREIDGLRALAVLPVIFFHAGFETFSGGFVGVDVFFVVSGYLITTIISAELERGKFSILDFYERRARRILPALFLVMLGCIPLAWFWLLPSDMNDFSQSLVAVSVFASNILFWCESGYFDTAAELKPLLHTWSLAVEEQYYVLFPLFLMLCWNFGKRGILVALGLVFVASLAVAQWAAYEKPAAAFYLLPTRGWELIIGAFVAFYLSNANQKYFGKAASEVGGWLGVALILYSISAYSKDTPFPGLYALVPTLGAALIILFATQQTSVGKLLGNKALVGIGLISYSAYLLHQPLFAFARQRSLAEPSDTILILLIILTLVLAYVSWKYNESYFRNRSLVSRKGIFFLSSIGSILFISVGIFGHLYQDEIAIYRFNDEQLRAISSASVSPKRSDCHFSQTNESLLRNPCRYFSDNTKVAVLGNSHATELAYSIGSVLRDRNIGIVQHTMSDCATNYKVLNEKNTICGQWHQKVVSSLIRDESITYVVLSYRNEHYLSNIEYRNGLANTANDLAAAGKKVILVLQVPMPVAHINRHFAKNISDLSGSIPSRKRSDWDNLYHESREILKLLTPDVVVFDPSKLFCQLDFCYVSINGIALFFDDHHISVAGSNLIAEALFREFFTSL